MTPVFPHPGHQASALPLWLCRFWTFRIQSVARHRGLCVWLLSTVFLRSIHVAACQGFGSFHGQINPLVDKLRSADRFASWRALGLIPAGCGRAAVSMSVRVLGLLESTPMSPHFRSPSVAPGRVPFWEDDGGNPVQCNVHSADARQAREAHLSLEFSCRPPSGPVLPDGPAHRAWASYLEGVGHGAPLQGLTVSG